jgi:hypothetical protein
VYDIESELRDFERFEYEDLLDLLEYMENDDLFASELDNYLNEKYQTQIDTLENWQVNYTYATSQLIIGLNDRITELENE